MQQTLLPGPDKLARANPYPIHSRKYKAWDRLLLLRMIPAGQETFVRDMLDEAFDPIEDQWDEEMQAEREEIAGEVREAKEQQTKAEARADAAEQARTVIIDDMKFKLLEMARTLGD
jgi:hypothetical protein